MEKAKKVRLRKMSKNEYADFCEYSIKDYAIDLQKEHDISLEESVKQAEEEFTDMLPQGLDTKDNALMIIEDYETGKDVGIIWYLFEVTDGISHTFLSDFIIKEEDRRKGYAIAALDAMEDDARNQGCIESRLYVWTHNPPGLNLYKKCGYVTFREVRGGMYMKKSLIS
jgi:ribosomal protein S18 acetylase RimI-like enzyme